MAWALGTVALALAAIGLYGVLSYGITRRSSEIAILWPWEPILAASLR
jgi:hypothetical protein